MTIPSIPAPESHPSRVGPPPGLRGSLGTGRVDAGARITDLMPSSGYAPRQRLLRSRDASVGSGDAMASGAGEGRSCLLCAAREGNSQGRLAHASRARDEIGFLGEVIFHSANGGMKSG